MLYHLGNNPLNRGAFDALRSRPGPIVLHEYVNFWYFYRCWNSLPRNERREFLDLYASALGVNRITTRSPVELAKLMAKVPLRGLDASVYNHRELQRLIDLRPNIDLFCLDAGAEKIAIDRASCVLMHGKATLNRLSGRYPSKRFVKIPFPVDRLDAGDPGPVRAKFGLSESGFVFATLGFGGKYKRLGVILDAWEKWKDRPADAVLCVIGTVDPDVVLSGREGVIATDYVADEDFDPLLLAVDCGIQLRYPSLGETSAVISRFVAYSMAVIISDVPEMRDYEDLDGVSYVPIGEAECDGLIDAMRDAYHRERRKPLRRDGYSWTDWANCVVPLLEHEA